MGENRGGVFGVKQPMPVKSREPKKQYRGGRTPSPPTFLHHALRSTWYKTLIMRSGALLSALVRFKMTEEKRKEERV